MKSLKPVLLATALLTLASQTTQAKPELSQTSHQAMATIETKADEAASFSQYDAVANALQPYIDAARTGDGKVSRGAFLDHAHIVGSVNGEFYSPDADAFAEIINQGGPSPDVQHRIVWIDISGPAAAAKVEFIHWRGFRYTDFFVLYRKDGEWKISGKVYDSHSNN